MQQEAKVTSKGQVTIPKGICQFLGIGEGDVVIFEADDSGVRLRPVRPPSVFAQYAGVWREGDGLTVEENIEHQRHLRGHDE